MQKFSQSSPLVAQSYNGLQDDHLAEYYASSHRRRHLRRMGLITREGMLVDELTFQRNALQKEQNRRYREAMALSATARDRETQQQQKAELRKKLEALAKYETVQRIKREKLHPLGVQTYRPNKTQPALGQTATLPDPHLSRILETHKHRVTFSPEELKEFRQLVEIITGARTTTLLAKKIVPRPPSTPKPKNQPFRVESGHTVRRRPHTAPTRIQRNAAIKTAGDIVQEQAVVKVTLCYLGTSKSVKKRRKRKIRTPPTEVMVQQQARGYTPIPVYRGQVSPGDSFAFKSIRHPGMPFALVIYTGGMIDCRVSVCCEYRHRAGTLLGGRLARFKVEAIAGGSPCFQCEAARKGKSKPEGPTAVYESTDSESEEHAQSTPQLMATLHPTQLDSSLQGDGFGGGRGEGGVGNSPSPVSSLYSASFHSESPQPSSSDEEDDNQQHQKGNNVSLHSSCNQSSAVPSEKEEEEEKEREEDNGLEQSLTRKSSFAEVSLEKQNSNEEAMKDHQQSCEKQPSLVTKGGVTIMYALGPVLTSESATQTDKQGAIGSGSLTETNAAQDNDNSSLVDHVTEGSKGNAVEENLENGKEEEGKAAEKKEEGEKEFEMEERQEDVEMEEREKEVEIEEREKGVEVEEREKEVEMEERQEDVEMEEREKEVEIEEREKGVEVEEREKEVEMEEREKEFEMNLPVWDTDDGEHSDVTVPPDEQDTVPDAEVVSPVTKDGATHPDMEEVESKEETQLAPLTNTTLQEVNDSLSSSSGSSSEHRQLQSQPKNGEFESTSTFTHVSERSDSTDGSEAASLPVSGGSVGEVMAPVKEPDTPGNRSEPEPKADENRSRESGSLEVEDHTEGHSTIMKEEEFTKAWT